jgi:hypothetical protein
MINIEKIKDQTDSTIAEDKKPTQTDDEKIIEAVEFINDKIGNSYYNTAVEIGDYVLKQFFNNDIKQVKSKLSNKENSFSKLCKNENLKIHPKHLNQMVLVAAQEKMFLKKEKKDILDKLNYSLKVELLKINTNQDKIKHAEYFVDKKLTVLQAKDYLKEKLGTVTTSDSIPLDNNFIKQIEQLSTLSNADNIDYDVKRITTVDRATDKLSKLKSLIDSIDKFSSLKDKLETVKINIEARKKELEEASKITAQPKKAKQKPASSTENQQPKGKKSRKNPK